MVARNAQTFQTTQRCQSADHRRLLSVVISFPESINQTHTIK